MIRQLARRLGVAFAYVVGHLRPRDRRTWVFGNITGFRDNPRYLAEYVIDHHPELTAWWLARSAPEADAARKAGLHVAMLGERQGTRLQRRAGVAFLTNGFQDLEAANLGGAYVVDLRHGKGLKRILLDQESWDRPEEPWSLLRYRFRRWFAARRLSQVDMVVAGGEWAKSMYVSAFGLPPSKVHVLGLPRYDVIQGGRADNRVVDGDVRRELSLESGKYVALWLPTWRESGDAGWLPHLQGVEIEGLWADEDLVLIVKRHPYTDPAFFAQRLPDHPKIRVLPEEEVDVNCLLRVADALVTDYSSAAFDYALLDRPIHFFVPDIDAYRGGRGLYEPLETLTGGRHHVTWTSLLMAIRDGAHGQDAEALAIARRIRERSRNNDSLGSCARITAAVASAVGLPMRGDEGGGRPA